MKVSRYKTGSEEVLEAEILEDIVTISQALPLPDQAADPRRSAPVIEYRRVRIPIGSSEILLNVPSRLSDAKLNKEIAGQDLVRRKLLTAIDRLDRVAGNNRELLFCSRNKLHGITREFLYICRELRLLVRGLSSYRSAIPELQDARENVQLFFSSYLGGEVEEIELLEQALFTNVIHEVGDEPKNMGPFRRKLAKCTGRVRTELQKIFAHLFASDPRNLYRIEGPRAEKDILFRQFHHDVEVTAHLYRAILKLDTYMRGAIVPSDVIKMISDKIDKEKSAACLFESDYYFFLNALIDEVLDTLIPEMRAILNLDGIWYDDFENIESKARMLSTACLEFRAFYNERSGLRQEVRSLGLNQDTKVDDNTVYSEVLRLFDTHRHRDVSNKIREIDQILVDLEGTLLQWQMGIARRAFAREEWRQTQPLERRPAK